MKQNRITKVEDMNVSPTCGKPLVVGSPFPVRRWKPNPFFPLMDIRYGTGMRREALENNRKYWQFEIENNGFNMLKNEYEPIYK